MNVRARFLMRILMFVILPLLLAFVVWSMMDFANTKKTFAKQAENELSFLTEAQAREFTNITSVMRSVVISLASEYTSQILLHSLRMQKEYSPENIPALAQNLLPQVGKRFEKIAQNFEYVSAAALVDLHGNVVVHTSQQMVGRNVQERGYFQKALQGEQSFENLDNMSADVLAGFFAHPVLLDGNIVGVAYVMLDLETIAQTTVNTMSFNKDGNAFVFSDQGRVLMHPQSQYRGREFGDQPWVAEVLASPAGIVNYEWDGQQKMGAFMRVPITNWTVVIAGVKGNILQIVNSSFQKSFIVSCMMICLIVCIFVLLHTIKKQITRRQEAFNELEKERALLRQIVADCPIAMCIYNDYTEIVMSNPALTNLTGFTVFDDMTALFDEADGLLLTNIFEDKSPLLHRDVTVYDTARNPIYIRLQLSLIEYRGKIAVLAWGQDITTLTRALEQAQEYSRAKSNFMSCMSHEIRTPMNAVLGMLYLVLQTNLSYEQEQYLLKTQSAATNLLGIINEILDFSKIEAGKMSLEITDFYLSDVIKHLSDLFLFSAEQKQITLFFFLSPHIPNALRGDKLRITQVLINLLGNAIKFTHEGKVVVYVTLVELNKDHVSVQFTVRDTGVGMTAEQMQKIYDPFLQADESITRKYGGTGLGLTISKSLLALMGSDISVESHLGAGTTFRFVLSLALNQTEVKVAQQNLRSLKILVVDDNSTDREFLGNLLVTHTVHMAETGQSGIKDIVRESTLGRPYDIVFLDWVMPHMSGYMFMVNLQKKLAGKKIPVVIVISAHEINDLVEQMIKLKITLFLPKPISAFAVQNSIVYALHNAKLAARNTHSSENLKLNQHVDGAKVLLAEDTPANIEVASKILQNMGCVVTVAVNGLEAVNKVQEEDFALVLMDIHMPMLDGMQATKIIRNLPDSKYKELPIIAMTALALAEEKEECYAAGMTAHMAKPFVPRELLALLERYLKKDGSPSLGQSETGADDQTSVGAVLPPMDGFDTAMGLLYLADNVALYIKQLKAFPDQYGDYAQQIHEALEEDDILTAKKLVHTLKGVSQMFGATDIATASRELEQAIKLDNAIARQGAQERLAAELQRVLHTLSQFPFEDYQQKEEGADGAADFAVEKAYIIEKVSMISRLMEEDFGAVLTLIDEMDEKLVSPAAIQWVAPVKYAVAKCDPVLLKEEVWNILEHLAT